MSGYVQGVRHIWRIRDPQHHTIHVMWCGERIGDILWQTLNQADPTIVVCPHCRAAADQFGDQRDPTRTDPATRGPEGLPCPDTWKPVTFNGQTVQDGDLIVVGVAPNTPAPHLDTLNEVLSEHGHRVFVFPVLQKREAQIIEGLLAVFSVVDESFELPLRVREAP